MPDDLIRRSDALGAVGLHAREAKDAERGAFDGLAAAIECIPAFCATFVGELSAPPDHHQAVLDAIDATIDERVAWLAGKNYLATGAETYPTRRQAIAVALIALRSVLRGEVERIYGGQA